MECDDAKAVALTILDLHIGTNSKFSNTCKAAADVTNRIKTKYVMSLEAPISRWQEQLAVHLDLSIRKVVPFTEGPMEKLAEMWQAHKDLPIPPQVGSVMKIPPPKK